MASRYAILPRSSIEVVHLPFHGGYRCLCSVTAVYARSRLRIAYVEEWRVLDLLSRRPGGGLGRLHDIEPIAVEEERLFTEQVVELWNHRMVVGNSPGFELAQSSLELCRV